MRADRLLEIILLLQTRGQMTAAVLAGELGVSERTIYRDLDALSAAGIPVEVHGGPGGGCALPDHYRTILTGVSPADIGAVLLASTLKPLADLGLDKKVETALHKLVATLPTAQRQVAIQGRQKFYLDSSAWFRRAEDVPFLSVIQEAVWKDKLVNLLYRRTDGTERERVFAPYGLVAKAGIWYLVGRVEGEFRVYRVSRILSATLLETSFSRPPDFDLPSYWADWSAAYEGGMPRFTATIHVEPKMVDILQSSFAILVVEVSPLDREKTDGLTFMVTFETFEFARNWILSCGAGVRVIAPTELLESIKTEAANILALY